MDPSGWCCLCSEFQQSQILLDLVDAVLEAKMIASSFLQPIVGNHKVSHLQATFSRLAASF